MPRCLEFLFFRVDQFVRGLANGLTFGAADYIAGAANTALRSGTLRDNIRTELEQSQQSGPAGTAGNVAGAILGAGKFVSSFLGGGGIRALRSQAKLYREMDVRARTATRYADRSQATIMRSNLKQDASDAVKGGALVGGSSVLASTTSPQLGLTIIEHLDSDARPKPSPSTLPRP